MGGEPTSSCYVSIPFGVSRGPGGVTIDFDALYTQAIRPTAESLGFIVHRADTLETRGVIHKAIYEAVLGADLMIADISSRSPNVIYELGMRHVARPAGTIVISCDTQIPFDLSLMRVLRYPPPTGPGIDWSASELSRVLSGTLRSAMKGQTDSPVHEMFPTLAVSLPTTIPWQGPANFLRMRLSNAQRLAGPDALDEIRRLEAAVPRETCSSSRQPSAPMPPRSSGRSRGPSSTASAPIPSSRKWGIPVSPVASMTRSALTCSSALN